MIFSNVRWYFHVFSLVTVSFRLLPHMASTLFDGSGVAKGRLSYQTTTSSACLPNPNGEYFCNVDA